MTDLPPSLQEGILALYSSFQGPPEYLGNLFRVRSIRENSIDGGLPVRLYHGGRLEEGSIPVTEKSFPPSFDRCYDIYVGEENIRAYLSSRSVTNGYLHTAIAALDKLNIGK